jgi:hypothetical protein
LILLYYYDDVNTHTHIRMCRDRVLAGDGDKSRMFFVYYYIIIIIIMHRIIHTKRMCDAPSAGETSLRASGSYQKQSCCRRGLLCPIYLYYNIIYCTHGNANTTIIIYLNRILPSTYYNTPFVFYFYFYRTSIRIIYRTLQQS